MVLGADGQLGRALAAALPDAAMMTPGRLRPDGPRGVRARRLERLRHDRQRRGLHRGRHSPRQPDGRRDAWAVNVTAVATLAKVAVRHALTLVTVSSGLRVRRDAGGPTRSTRRCSPLGVYGQTKAAGEAVTSTVPRHYIVGTSWLVGVGPQLRLHDAGPGPTGDQPRRRRRPDRPVDAPPRSSPTGIIALLRDKGAVRRATTSPAAGRHGRGPTSPGTSSPRRGGIQPTCTVSRPRSTPGGRRSPPARATAAWSPRDRRPSPGRPSRC